MESLARIGRWLRWIGGIAIAGGVTFSAVRVVMLLAQQAFEQVAAAGQPAVFGLLGGGAVIGIGNLLIDPPRLGGGGNSRPGNPVVTAGGVVALLGLAYAVYGVLSFAFDPTMSGFAPLAAGPGLAIALLGGGIMLLGALIGQRGRR